MQIFLDLSELCATHFFAQSWQREKKTMAQVDREQGDQIGQIFAIGSIFFSTYY
jgi:hypothetical protein